MNLALWKKAVSDAWLTLVVSSVLLILFCWLFVWLMSHFDMGAWSTMLNLLPNFVQPMLGVPLAKLATPAGQLSFLYVHVVTILVCVGWAVGRGSASISGEIGRGTMDLLLSLPVWRMSVMTVPAVVATLGAAVLAASVWAGLVLGLLCVKFHQPPPPQEFSARRGQPVCHDVLFHGHHHLRVLVEPRPLADNLHLGRVLRPVVDPRVCGPDVARRRVAPLSFVSQPVSAAGIDPCAGDGRLGRLPLGRHPAPAGLAQLRDRRGNPLAARHPAPL